MLHTVNNVNFYNCGKNILPPIKYPAQYWYLQAKSQNKIHEGTFRLKHSINIKQEQDRHVYLYSINHFLNLSIFCKKISADISLCRIEWKYCGLL